ncbi:MAG: hypothetical protein IPQ18_10775 [Saprospiraceae bacterium]|nr:hypothetical protein [Saprospiraceae bacterium]
MIQLIWTVFCSRIIDTNTKFVKTTKLHLRFSQDEYMSVLHTAFTIRTKSMENAYGRCQAQYRNTKDRQLPC